ncbi:MAG: DUF6428 family protein [Flavobacterium sp.]|uniref:DUF6428 family protein n=1 Tax=Flavobacterium sp. TaxID=239 RepID=UPI0032679E55
MNLSEIKKTFRYRETINFILENGATVPEHFHVTEVGIISKRFIDCGGIPLYSRKIHFYIYPL